MLPITICVTCKDRSSLFRQSLKSLHEQSCQPACIAIADASDDRDSLDTVLSEFKEYSPIKIAYEWRPASELTIAKGRNLACELADTPLAISTETDILFPPNALEVAMKEFETGFKRSKYRKLRPWITPNLEKLGPDGKTFKKKRCENGAFQFYRLEDFKKIGGYNTCLKTWGYEDCDFRTRAINTGYKVRQVDFVLTHLWHEMASQKKLKQQLNKNNEIAHSTYWDGQEWRYE